MARVVVLLAALAATADGFGLAPALGPWRAPAAAAGRRAGPALPFRPVRPRVGASAVVAMAQDEAEAQQSAILKKHAGRVVKIADPEGWVAIQKIAEMKSAVLLTEFRAMNCRKCAALEGKYARLPKKFEGKAVLFAEVDAQKVGKQVREEAGVVKVPTFQIWVDGAKVEGYLAEDISVTMTKVEAMVQRNLHLAKGHELFRDVRADSEEPEDGPVADPLAGWRRHQSSMLRAPGVSSAQSSTTLMRTPGDSDEEPAAPEGGAGGGASSKELLSEVEAVKPVVKKASGQSNISSKGDGPKLGGASREELLARGGGSSREELLAQLEAITAKKKLQ